MNGEVALEVVQDQAPPRMGKPPELEDWLNSRVYHPLSGRLARSAEGTFVTPNMISLAGGAMVVSAGLFYTLIPGAAGVALGLLAHMLWHVLDGADGALARRTGQVSPWGELIDGACDYVSHFILYCLLGIVLLAQTIGWWAYPIGIAAGLSRIAQSAHSERGRRNYMWRVHGIPWLKQERPEGEARRRSPLARLMAAVGSLYVATDADPVATRADALVVTGGEEARRLCKQASRVPLWLQTHLGPNLRTLALGASMAAGSPLWYFLAEVVVGNALLLWSKSLQRRCDLAVIRALEG